MSLLLWPVKLLGLAATGAALGIGWKVGTLIYDKVEEALGTLDTPCTQPQDKTCAEKQVPPEPQA